MYLPGGRQHGEAKDLSLTVPGVSCEHSDAGQELVYLGNLVTLLGQLLHSQLR